MSDSLNTTPIDPNGLYKTNLGLPGGDRAAAHVLQKTLSRLLVKATYPRCLCGANTACDEPHLEDCEVLKAVNEAETPLASAGHHDQKTLTVRRYGGRIHITEASGLVVFSFDIANLNHNNMTFDV